MLKWTKNSKQSIILKIALLMTLVALLQALFGVALITGTNVPATLKNNAYGLFAERVEARKTYLLSEMTNRWSNISSFKTQITQEYDAIIDSAASLSPKDTLAFLDASTSILTDMMKTSMSSGGFIILDDAEGEGASQSGIFIQNYNPTLNANSASSSNLAMLRGPNDISKKYKIPLDNAWSYGFPLDARHRDILEKPLAAAALTDCDQYQGYWHVSPSFSNPNNRSITYSLPLRDQNGRLFGVIGVEVSQDYLYKLLPSDEFAQSESYGYMLVTIDRESGDIIPLISQGTVQKSIVALDAPMSLRPANEPSHCFFTDTPIGRISTCYEEIGLYSPNTPFEDSHWFLMGLTAMSNITTFSDHLNRTLFFMISLSVVLGAAISFLIGYYFARPIVRLSQAVQTSHFDGSFSLARTGITEIDDLSSAIEQLSRNILDSALKTDQILKVANVGVGSFEYKRGGDYVTVSTSLQRMFGMTAVEHSTFSVPQEHFFRVLEEIKSLPEAELDSTYLLNENPKRWYKITEIESSDGLLGVVIDVTRDVLERHALNYERDYDTVTGIYNRLAFHRKAQAIFSTEDLKVAAIAMFDLDNLKYVNDTYGHELGDLYIKTAARIMNATLHRNTVVGRMAGDEFYVFFYGFNQRDEILHDLKQLYRALDNDLIILPDGSQFKVRMSGGISWYNVDSRDYNELIRYADFAMYEGKHTVKGELREFKRDVYLSESFMLSGKEELNRVLDNQIIDFVFQPIVHAKSGELYGYEALMRPQSELLCTPLKLIQLATAQSQLWKIENLTFFKTLSHYSKYRDLFGDAKLFINSVANQILKESEYQEFEHLYGDVLQNIVVEVIENERLDAETFQLKLSKIESWGAKIALDNYGSGYTNNSDLTLLSIHPYIIKLDPFLISNVVWDATHQAIVSKIISFCKEHHIFVLAEGVETKEQLAFLIRADVDFLQGYYIGKPEPVPNFNNSALKVELNALSF